MEKLSDDFFPPNSSNNNRGNNTTTSPDTNPQSLSINHDAQNTSAEDEEEIKYKTTPRTQQALQMQGVEIDEVRGF